jgi:hypothetical protein
MHRYKVEKQTKPFLRWGAPAMGVYAIVKRTHICIFSFLKVFMLYLPHPERAMCGSHVRACHACCHQNVLLKGLFALLERPQPPKAFSRSSTLAHVKNVAHCTYVASSSRCKHMQQDGGAFLLLAPMQPKGSNNCSASRCSGLCRSMFAQSCKCSPAGSSCYYCFLLQSYTNCPLAD